MFIAQRHKFDISHYVIDFHTCGQCK